MNWLASQSYTPSRKTCTFSMELLVFEPCEHYPSGEVRRTGIYTLAEVLLWTPFYFV